MFIMICMVVSYTWWQYVDLVDWYSLYLLLVIKGYEIYILVFISSEYLWYGITILGKQFNETSNKYQYWLVYDWW